MAYLWQFGIFMCSPNYQKQHRIRNSYYKDTSVYYSVASGEEVRAKNGKEKVRKRVRFRGQQKGSTHWDDISPEILQEDSNSH